MPNPLTEPLNCGATELFTITLDPRMQAPTAILVTMMVVHRTVHFTHLNIKISQFKSHFGNSSKTGPNKFFLVHQGLRSNQMLSVTLKLSISLQ